MALIGYVWDDAWDAIEDVATSVYDTADAIGRQIGIQHITGPLGRAIESVWNGPLRDFSRQWYGKIVVRAFFLQYNAAATAAGLSGTAAAVVQVPGIGPVLAPLVPTVQALAPTISLVGQQIAVAGPGIVRGEKFVQAYTTEALWQAEQLALYFLPGLGSYLGKIADGTIAQITGQWINYLKQIPLGTLDRATWLGVTVGELAERMGLDRCDLALQIQAWASGREDDLLAWIGYQHAPDFDWSTGRRRSEPPTYSEDQARLKALAEQRALEELARARAAKLAELGERTTEAHAWTAAVLAEGTAPGIKRADPFAPGRDDLARIVNVGAKAGQRRMDEAPKAGQRMDEAPPTPPVTSDPPPWKPPWSLLPLALVDALALARRS